VVIGSCLYLFVLLTISGIFVSCYDASLNRANVLQTDGYIENETRTVPRIATPAFEAMRASL
jgi:hypothetical protein